MKQILCFILLSIAIISCNDEEKLYHPEEKPEIKWLLKTVDYPELNPGFITRKNQTFHYTDNDDILFKISNPNQMDSLLKVDLIGDKVYLSRMVEYTSYTLYDSIIVKLNDKKQALYALHQTQIQYKDGERVMSTDDSTAFVYDVAGYAVQYQRYSESSKPVTPSHIVRHTISNGNITMIEVETSYNAMYRYTYTYDDKEHAIPSDYCYEMPFNTSATSGCWLFTNMAFLTDHFGKKSNNNVIHMTGERIVNGSSNPYGDITYNYTYDENNLLTQVEMSGISPTSNASFNNFINSFSYYEKEIYK